MNSDKSKMNACAAPSAPENFDMGLQPPSYEDCVKMDRSGPHQNMYSNHTAYQQAYNPTLVAPGSSQISYGYANPYQMHIQHQQNYYNTPASSTQVGIKNTGENVLYLAKGAKVRTTNTGAISIPPPPPGCAPTPGQIAAMSGQPVIIKKQKKRFF